MKKTLLFLSLLCAYFFLYPACAEIRVNELMADNGEFISGENYDWIEIYNDGSQAVDLSGWGLSDKPKNPLLWQFPQGSLLSPGDYAIVYCTGEEGLESAPAAGCYYASFKLAAEGETILLSNQEGKLLDALEYPPQFGNTAYGLSPVSGEWGFFDAATPGSKNPSSVYTARSPRPVIDQAAGFYTLAAREALQITLSGDGPIRYTLDGSTPDRSSPLYTGPISITKTTVVRARICREDALMSPVLGATFLINDPSPAAVISLSTDEKYLYDPEIGLLVPGDGAIPNYMTDMEHPVYFEYFDQAGQRQLAQSCSFRIVGDSSRIYPQKSLAVFARDQYGDEDRFYYNPFENRDYAAYRAYVLRSAGSDYRSTRLKDPVFTAASKGLGLMYQDARPVVVYINGAYAGHYNLREKINKYSVAQWEGVTDQALIDQIDLLTGAAQDHQVMNGSNEDWLSLLAFAEENDLSQPQNLQYVLDRLDVDSLFKWACMEIFLGNPDLENVRTYRTPGGKWKYILYDAEGGLLNDPIAAYMLLSPDRLPQGWPAASQHSLLKNLLASPQMRAQFLQTAALVLENSFLYDQTLGPLFDQWEAALSPLLPRHLACYGLTQALPLEKWRAHVEAARQSAQEGPALLLDTLCDLLSVTQEERERYFSPIEALIKRPNASEK